MSELQRQVVVHADPAQLCQAVAAEFLSLVSAMLETQEQVHVVLTGGSMGIGLLKEAGVLAERETPDWSRVHFWWGDERWVPRGHDDRNDAQADAAFLSKIDIPEANLHRFAGSDEGIDLDAAATRTAKELSEASAHGGAEQPWPAFDLVFLGVGPDGHIASLFPNRNEVLVKDVPVVAVRNSPKPPPERLSLTRPVLNSAKHVWLVLSGAEKASVLGLALAGAQLGEVPAAGAKGRESTVFFVDEAAAAEVPESLTMPSDEFHALHRPSR